MVDNETKDKKNRLIYTGNLVDDIDSIVNIFTTSHPAKKILTQVVGNYKEMVLRCIEMQPTVDAVEVVRCKDCKHWQLIHEHIPHMECQIFCGAYEHGYPTNADDFCSCGERRTDERKAD